jgi:NAD(P)-dependent dehydrogenase (short-subunit alcohol dehydrogenase family)
MSAPPRCALVTGAASGIGLAIAERFARAGLQVAMLDVDPAALERESARLRAGAADLIAAQADVADEVTARAAVERVERDWGRIDVLVNNAGLPSAWSEGDDWQRWRYGIDQTLSSVYLMCQLVAPGMSRRRTGSIINVASRAAYLPMPGAEWYGAAKAGVVSLTRSLATRLGPDGIRVNALCPDVIETPRTRAMLADEARRRALTARIPLGRLGRPEDVAEAAFFLASDETAGFITGTALMIDGGAGG